MLHARTSYIIVIVTACYLFYDLHCVKLFRIQGITTASKDAAPAKPAAAAFKFGAAAPAPSNPVAPSKLLG